MRMMAFDPGGTTGWCYATEDSDGWRIYDRGQLTGEHHASLYDLLDVCNYMPDIVICERFQHRQTLGVNQDALEYIGVIKLWCQHNGKEPVWHTSAQMNEKLWSDRALKKIGLWKPNQRHAADATRHALVWITDRDPYYIRLLK